MVSLPAQCERSSACPTGFCLNSEENSFRNDSPTLPIVKGRPGKFVTVVFFNSVKNHFY